MAFKWHDFTKTDWENAHYCEECGLPTLKDNNGKYYCLHCAEINKWRKYATRIETEKLHAVEDYKKRIESLQEEIKTIKEQQKERELRRGVVVKEEWLIPKISNLINGRTYLVKVLNWHDQEEVYIDTYMGDGQWLNTKQDVYRYKELT